LGKIISFIIELWIDFWDEFGSTVYWTLLLFLMVVIIWDRLGATKSQDPKWTVQFLHSPTTGLCYGVIKQGDTVQGVTGINCIDMPAGEATEIP